MVNIEPKQRLDAFSPPELDSLIIEILLQHLFGVNQPALGLLGERQQ